MLTDLTTTGLVDVLTTTFLGPGVVVELVCGGADGTAVVLPPIKAFFPLLLNKLRCFLIELVGVFRLLLTAGVDKGVVALAGTVAFWLLFHLVVVVVVVVEVLLLLL